jgi:hypothetical protein
MRINHRGSHGSNADCEPCWLKGRHSEWDIRTRVYEQGSRCASPFTGAGCAKLERGAGVLRSLPRAAGIAHLQSYCLRLKVSEKPGVAQPDPECLTGWANRNSLLPAVRAIPEHATLVPGCA